MLLPRDCALKLGVVQHRSKSLQFESLRASYHCFCHCFSVCFLQSLIQLLIRILTKQKLWMPSAMLPSCVASAHSKRAWEASKDAPMLKKQRTRISGDSDDGTVQEQQAKLHDVEGGSPAKTQRRRILKRPLLSTRLLLTQMFRKLLWIANALQCRAGPWGSFVRRNSCCANALAHIVVSNLTMIS